MPDPHGWQLYAHPVFLEQWDRLAAAVERAKRADPVGWRSKADARLLASLHSLLVERIPRDPLSPEFRQGNALGRGHRHWFRAKFGGNRFRLFFRADSQARVIVYAWVNDRDTLRKAGAVTDPYAVFSRMLAAGNPPGDWPALLAPGAAVQGRGRSGGVNRLGQGCSSLCRRLPPAYRGPRRRFSASSSGASSNDTSIR